MSSVFVFARADGYKRGPEEAQSCILSSWHLPSSVVFEALTNPMYQIYSRSHVSIPAALLYYITDYSFVLHVISSFQLVLR